jgi:hypothetical protein
LKTAVRFRGWRLAAALGLMTPLPLAPNATGGELPDCKAVAGWQQRGPVRNYTAETLYDYMNGNSEGYLIYQFAKMTGLTCVSGGNAIVIDISEMSDPESAYGIFCANRDPNQADQKIGMAGQIKPRRAVFVKGKYYVELAANPAQEAALKSFVALMEPNIKGRTALPEALEWFPKEKLQAGSLRLIPESALGIRILKRGYVAPYEQGKAFVVPEENEAAAKATMEKLRARIGETTPAKLGDEAFTATDKYLGPMFVFRKGRFVGGTSGMANGAPVAEALAGRVK